MASIKKINLIVNDGKQEKVVSVQNYINENNINHCEVEYHNKSAEIMFKETIALINAQNKYLSWQWYKDSEPKVFLNFK